MDDDPAPAPDTFDPAAGYWPDTPAPGWLTDAERQASLDAMLADHDPAQP
ncbi:MAG: hypothetical protein JNL25_18175, partial [Rhodospirillaceae bacterium]|nr:hypothetical protein [Rhodospirillaceae bacterium]